mmetsp:Transcript_15071/g.42744  ORF Transcript_15071/g.42744 Transcript_15071/m.42744 type:complete len:327 (+) Transcript_15071:129-1109(+)|eukprot:CAMPEP_0202085874 /NCGR_PEP_ID=MMETSP0964-20121228/31918_1 /ASSEMBLY_ACC=CAM_ASM_000500 /TAXON_ID=4773 /ORGANISM="Schizochytrium aggregatum, Strain ATCC28209" /LENGTH=326 /DNA_ID=CAMNT_0048653731 /DNA_START=95 /DNA_END=1075 /DNA_ORIENTATION=-
MSSTESPAPLPAAPAEARTAERIDGKAISAEIRAEVLKAVEELVQAHNVTPGLAVVLVGSRPDSATYVRMKKRAAKEAGIHSVSVELEESVTQAELEKTVDELNARSDVHGILVQLPLPAHIDEHAVLKRIRVDKDVDGFSAENIGNLALKGGEPPLAVPCTPAGCVELLQRSGVDCSGKHAVIVGRSNIVGMPMAHLLLSMDATVTVVHSKTPDIQEHVRRADIIIAAVGRREMIRGDWVKPGAVIIDIGINDVPDETKKSGYRLVGDVCFSEALAVASKITPVPGGVGPMTIAMLMRNTLNLARHALGLPRIPLRRHHDASTEQ